MPKMKILSLYDGMSCGMLAMMAAGVPVEEYHAYEIDKYAVLTSQHNFPQVIHHGDVFKGDFTQYRGFDGVVGGSPCTYWSIAQKNHRETTPDGIGGQLFEQYYRAVEEAQPKWFIYENNKSMANAIREYISGRFGFEPVCINSALVSAQNRQRLYWVGRRNPDGTYSRVDIQQPEDRGILLKDVLDGAGARELTEKEMEYMVREVKGGRNHFDFGYIQVGSRDKGQCLTANVSKGVPYNVCCEPVPFRQAASGKGFCLDASYWKTPGSPETFLEGGHARANRNMAAEPVGTTRDGKSYCMTAGYANGSGENIGNYAAHTLEKGCKSMAAEPVNPDALGKAHCLVGGRGGVSIAHDIAESRHNLVGEPVPFNPAVNGKSYALTSTYYKASDAPASEFGEEKRRPRAAEPVRIGCLPSPDGTIKNSQGMRVYSIEGKSVTQTAQGGGSGAKTGLYAVPVGTTADGKSFAVTAYYSTGQNAPHTLGKHIGSMAAEPIPQYAVPVEWDSNGNPAKAVSGADGKAYTVYQVQGGMITIKEKTYPIKLVDGYWIIRKLTVSECKRLQTVPEWYDFSCVSNTQAYKMLGNGWTVEVIAHLIRGCLSDEPKKVKLAWVPTDFPEFEQLRLSV